MGFYYGWRPYVPVAQRQRRAQKKISEMKKKGQSFAPVTIEGCAIAKSFWGKSWCDNLERYSDYENRLSRGRTYVRNGSVVDLQIEKGEVAAWVSGSELYQVKATIAPVKAGRWTSICRDCAGAVNSLVELLQGRLAKGVMDRVCRKGDGLFPAPTEIKLACSCPDWANMCKHVAAVLYGVGARLDHNPQLLFVLRGVDESDLLARAGQDLPLAKTPPSANVLDDSDVAAVFGLDMAEAIDSIAASPAARKRAQRRKTAGCRLRRPARSPPPRGARRPSAAHARLLPGRHGRPSLGPRAISPPQRRQSRPPRPPARRPSGYPARRPPRSPARRQSRPRPPRRRQAISVGRPAPGRSPNGLPLSALASSGYAEDRGAPPDAFVPASSYQCSKHDPLPSSRSNRRSD
jgi:uncharacterized Zn finger protein